MNFDLSDEMRMLKETAHKFAMAEMAPISHESDLEEKYTPELRKKAAQNGLVGAWLPERYGGSDVGILGMSLIAEELARVDLGLSLNIIAATFGSEIIYMSGTEEQKMTYIPPVCRGEMVSAGAFTEPDAGTDVAGFRTKAVKDGKDYVITGNKMFITNGTICDFFVVQCMTNPDAAKRYERFSTIIVPANAAGITASKIRGKMGVRASDTSEVSFDEVRVPQSNLIGTEGQGFKQLMPLFNQNRIFVGALGVGLGSACLSESIKYAKERTAFGTPIGSFQLTQAKLTEMAIRIEALRALTYKTAWMADQGRFDHIFAAMCKYLGGQTAVFCANAALEIHGGYGYINEYKVEKYYRDAKILELFEGTKEAEILAIGRALQN